MKAIPLSLYLLLLTACAMNSVPSIQDSIAASAAIIETVAESTQLAYEAGRISDDERQGIANNLQQAQDYTRLANQSFLQQDAATAIDQLSQALRFVESAQLLKARYEQ